MFDPGAALRRWLACSPQTVHFLLQRDLWFDRHFVCFHDRPPIVIRRVVARVERPNPIINRRPRRQVRRPPPPPEEEVKEPEEEAKGEDGESKGPEEESKGPELETGVSLQSQFSETELLDAIQSESSGFSETELLEALETPQRPIET